MVIERDLDMMLTIALVGFAELIEPYYPDLAREALEYADMFLGVHDMLLLEAVGELLGTGKC